MWNRTPSLHPTPTELLAAVLRTHCFYASRGLQMIGPAGRGEVLVFVVIGTFAVLLAVALLPL